MFDGLDPVVQPLYIAPSEYHRWAERVAPAVARMAAFSRGRYRAEDIAALCSSGHMQMWIVLDGISIACVMVTEIVNYPRLRVMRCAGLVGSRPRRWMHLLAEVERAARDCFGCQEMEAFVQPRHERLLRTGGWKLFHMQWHKELA